MGASIDSVHCHANWARDLGGVSFPLLSDFEPKGAVARSFGRYLADAGITDRATVLIDKDGIVRYSVSVTPSGRRDIDELAEVCERIDREQSKRGKLPVATPIAEGTTLFVKSSCGHSRKALLAVDNLHLGGKLLIRNVSEDPQAGSELERVGGKNQAPCLVCAGEAPMYEASDIVRSLADRVAPLA